MRPEPGGSFPAPQLLGWPKGLIQAGIARLPAQNPSGWSALPPAVSREVPPTAAILRGASGTARFNSCPCSRATFQPSSEDQALCCGGDRDAPSPPAPRRCRVPGAVPGISASRALLARLQRAKKSSAPLPGGGRQRSRRSSRISLCASHHIFLVRLFRNLLK